MAAAAAEGKRSGGRALTLLRGGPGNGPGGTDDHDRRGLQGTSIPVDARQQPEMMAPLSFDPPSDEELKLGIREGRSSACVSVDRSGIPESHLDVGVMRVGDVSFDETDVQLGLELVDDVEMPGLGRFLLDRAAEGGRSLRQGDVGMYASVLRQEDKDAIGAVTSEVSFWIVDDGPMNEAFSFFFFFESASDRGHSGWAKAICPFVFCFHTER